MENHQHNQSEARPKQAGDVQLGDPSGELTDKG
jgi:hypothetical protein